MPPPPQPPPPRPREKEEETLYKAQLLATDRETERLGAAGRQTDKVVGPLFPPVRVRVTSGIRVRVGLSGQEAWGQQYGSGRQEAWGTTVRV